MTYSDQSYNLRIELDQKGCELTSAQIEKLETSLGTLRKVVAKFPVSDLYITILYHKRSQDYHVKTALALPGKRLFTGDRDIEVHPAFERCVRKLVRKVNSYKRHMQGEDEFSKQAEGTHQMVSPSQEPDMEEIASAVEQGDYGRFRRSMGEFEESLRNRIGRWLQRYPEIEDRIEEDFSIDDIVEEVFLNAFEQFPNHSRDVPPGVWLEHLIDPSVQAILQSPDEEFANISFARSMLEAGSS